MKTIFAFVLMAALVPAVADDMRDRVTGRQDRDLTRVIEPDKGIYGVPYGTSEDEFTRRFGKPMGFIRLNETESAILYGKKHAFLFSNGKLAGVRIGFGIIDWKLGQQVTQHSVFDNLVWKLDNGLAEESTLADCKKILGGKLQSDQYGYARYYVTAKARVELDFAHRTDLGNEDTAYILQGLYVRLK